MLVLVLDPGADNGFERLNALVHSAADRLGGQVAEPLPEHGGPVAGQGADDGAVSESEDNLNVPAKCGLRSNLRQIRPIMDLDWPVRRAIDAHLLPY